MIAWPATLPQKMDRSFNAVIAYGQADPTEQINPIRTRTNPEYKATMSVLMTQTQLHYFMTFYKTTLNDGCEAFSASWLADAEFNNYFAVFIKTPTITNKETLWLVKMELNLLHDGS